MMKPRVSIGSVVTIPQMRLSVDSQANDIVIEDNEPCCTHSSITHSPSFYRLKCCLFFSSSPLKATTEKQENIDDNDKEKLSSSTNAAPSMPSSKVLIPGLRLTASDTKDGTPVVGKGLSVSTKSDSAQQKQPLSTEETTKSTIQKKAITIPGLKLTAADTKDGTTTTGKGTTLLKSPSSSLELLNEEELTDNSSDDGDDEGDNEGEASESNSESERENENENGSDTEPAPPMVKIAIPGLKLTAADTKDGLSSVGKGTLIVKTAVSSSCESLNSSAPSDSSSDSDSEVYSDEDKTAAPPVRTYPLWALET